MSQKASPTAIGAFVLGAVVLIVAALLIFGSGRFLQQPDTYVLFFKGSAKGLNVGSAVAFRGVKIGSVTRVQLVNDVLTQTVYVGVIIEIDPNAFHNVRSKPGVSHETEMNILKHLIDKLGLRAKLAPQSLVTGQLYVNFDFYPGTPAQLYKFDLKYSELPTLPSTLEEMQTAVQRLLKALETLPLQKLLQQMAAAAEGINKMVSSAKLQETPQLLNESLANIRDLAARLNERITPLTESLQNTSDETGAAMADIRLMLRDRNSGEVIHLAEDLDAAARQARELLNRTDNIVSRVNGSNIERMIRELTEAARSLRILADYLQRHPEALLRGKD